MMTATIISTARPPTMATAVTQTGSDIVLVTKRIIELHIKVHIDAGTVSYYQ